MRAVLLLLVLLIVPATQAQAESFREVRGRVYSEPLATNPAYKLPLAKAITLALARLSGELIDRAKATLTEVSDFKPARPKLIHPVGICAEGVWTIDQPSPATGLLSRSSDGSATKVRAMVRFSMATNDPVYKPGSKRNMGMAIKLFPTQDDRQSVVTRNVFTLDQTGLTGDDRQSFFFHPNEKPGSVFFTNEVSGTGFLAWLGQRTFEKLDSPSTFRGLHPLTEIAGDGQRVAKPSTPRLIAIVPAMRPKAGQVPEDFRDEIRQYAEPGSLRFHLVLPADGELKRAVRIGSLVLGRPVVSPVCDLELHFHHAPESKRVF